MMDTDVTKVMSLLNLARRWQTPSIASLKKKAIEEYPDWTEEEVDHHICQLQKELR